jgi:hypothetical protein
MRWVAIFEDDPEGLSALHLGKAPAYGSVTL